MSEERTINQKLTKALTIRPKNIIKREKVKRETSERGTNDEQKTKKRE